LTKKSTEAHLKALHRAGRLAHYDQTLWPDDTCLRRLWLHPTVRAWVKKYFAGTRAFFSTFVAGADFDDDDMLKALSEGKDGLWEFRITFQPQWRVFGGFLRNGEIVALAQAKRGDLQKSSFGPIIMLVKNRWKSLFPDQSPLLSPRNTLVQDFDDDI
jgi:hypothetical protein